MLLFIQHETNYSYSRRLDRSVQIARLTPRIDAGQRTLRWQLQSPGRQLEQVDAFGNITHLITVDEPLEEINVIADGVIEDGRVGECADREVLLDDGRPHRSLRRYHHRNGGPAVSGDRRSGIS